MPGLLGTCAQLEILECALCCGTTAHACQICFVCTPSNSSQVGFVAITAVGVLACGTRVKVLLYFAPVDKDSKDSISQAETLTGVIDSYSIDSRVVGIASDGAADVTKAARLTGYLHSVCWVHLISNTLKDCAVTLEPMMKSLRRVIKQFRASNKMRQAAQEWAALAGMGNDATADEAVDGMVQQLRTKGEEGGHIGVPTSPLAARNPCSGSAVCNDSPLAHRHQGLCHCAHGV